MESPLVVASVGWSVLPETGPVNARRSVEGCLVVAVPRLSNIW